MKKLFFVLIALCFVSSLAFAEDAAAPAPTTATEAATATTTTTATVADVPVVAPVTAAVAPEVLTLKGDVIDNGYSIFADGKLYKFDKDSSAKVAEFLKAADSKLQVTITAKQVGDELSLVSIENQN